MFDVHTMRHNDNDPTDPLPFVTLAAATANVLRYLKLTKEAEKYSAHKGERNRTQEDRNEQERDYIRERIREIERFEQRAKGIIRPRPRRQRT